MSKKNKNPELTPPVEETSGVAVKEPKKKKKKKGSGLLGRIVRRFFLLLFTVVILALVALVMVMNVVFNGPSPAARNILTMSLTEASATKWVPGLFLGDELVAEIRQGNQVELTEEITNTDLVVINRDNAASSDVDEFANEPDGIIIEHYAGDTFNAHIMLIDDPSRVFMGTSSPQFSTSIPGKRITEAIEEAGESVVAAVNAGAFYDDGSANSIVGSVPAGLVYARGEMVWDAYHGLVPATTGGGFVGFNDDDVLVVAKSMTNAEAEAQNIRDGCEFGPVLIVNGEVNMEAYTGSGWNPRTAIGQRADGVVIFICVDGRQAGSVGATYGDVIDMMLEYGAVNACNLDGGSSTVMMYRDTHGKLGEPGEVKMINNYSLLQSKPRRMPNYWMVSAVNEE